MINRLAMQWNHSKENDLNGLADAVTVLMYTAIVAERREYLHERPC